MKKNRKKRWFLLLLFLTIGIAIWNGERLERWIFPIKYEQEIRENALNYQLSPLFVAAVIRAESNYKPYLVSKKGAVGLMQLMPETARWAASRMQIEEPTTDELYDAKLNIQIGSWYLQSLRTQFDGNETAMIAAYNAGPTNVRNWLNEGIWDGERDTISQIPFGETRHYLHNVHKYYQQYLKLYGTEYGELYLGE